MVLSREKIKEAIAARELLIDPLDEERFTPNGYLVAVGKVSVPKVHWTVRQGFVAVGKLTRFIITSFEHISIGGDLSATLTLSSKLGEKGVVASFPRLNSGFSAHLKISAFNTSVRTIDVSHGDIVGELIFERPIAVAPAETKGPLEGPSVERPAPAHLASPIEYPLKGLQLDPRDGGHPCREHDCTLCCHGTEMPLTKDDQERLEGLGHSDFYIEDDGWLILRNIDDACYFLKDERCSIYKDRPLGCTFYPAVYSREDERAIQDDDCPFTKEFAITGTLDKDLRKLVQTVQSQRSRRLLKRDL